MIKTIFIASFVMASTAASAATTVYSINQTIGMNTVSGTVETNGTVGVLDASDITAFDLTVGGPGADGGPGAVIDLNQDNSIIRVTGDNFTATPGNLFFNYSGAPGYLLFQLGSFGTGMQYYCNASTTGDCFQGASAVPERFDSATAQFEPRVGNQAIGGILAPVPEPASWALMVAGFGLVGAALRRKSAAAVVYA